MTLSLGNRNVIGSKHSYLISDFSEKTEKKDMIRVLPASTIFVGPLRQFLQLL